MTMARVLKIFSGLCLVLVFNTSSMNIRDSQLIVRQHHNKSDYNYRVHKGRDVRDGEYPYVVVMGRIVKDSLFWRMCTGSMITDTWGITAAHCLEVRHVIIIIQYDNFTESPLDTGCYVPVIEMYSHPSYRGETRYVVNNDIGVFRSKSVPKKPYAILLATDYSTLIGLPVVYVGAGMTKWNMDDNDWIRPLQLGEATIVTCGEELTSKLIICLAPKCSNRLERPWYGDSGGPLIYDGKIIGVFSIFMPSTVMASSGYVPVSPYIDWIHHVINVTGA